MTNACPYLYKTPGPLLSSAAVLLGLQPPCPYSSQKVFTSPSRRTTTRAFAQTLTSTATPWLLHRPRIFRLSSSIAGLDGFTSCWVARFSCHGTVRFRLYRLHDAGLTRRSHDHRDAVLPVPPGRFPAALDLYIVHGDILHDNQPFIPWPCHSDDEKGRPFPAFPTWR